MVNENVKIESNYLLLYLDLKDFLVLFLKLTILAEHNIFSAKPHHFFSILETTPYCVTDLIQLGATIQEKILFESKYI